MKLSLFRQSSLGSVEEMVLMFTNTVCGDWIDGYNVGNGETAESESESMRKHYRRLSEERRA